jgi:hypothetical protein
MGQYHITINLDKREYIFPHKIGLGLKLMEQCGFRGSTGDILFLLLACSNGRGGGDCQTEHENLIGRWAGDRIVVAGDYCKPDDVPGINIEEIHHNLCSDPKYLTPEGLAEMEKRGETLFKDISDELIPLINEQFDCNLRADGDGWRRRDDNPPLRPDMILGFPK